MPKVGLKHIVAAKLIESGTTATYSAGKVIAEAIKVDTKWDKGDAKVYSDDKLSESDCGVTGGKQTLEVNDISLEDQAFLLGHTYSEEGGLVESEGDIAPFVGHGYYGRTVLHGTVGFTAVWIFKTQFGQPDDSAETKGEKPKFITPKIEGDISFCCNGKIRVIKEFTSEAEAVSWLDSQAGITAQSKQS